MKYSIVDITAENYQELIQMKLSRIEELELKLMNYDSASDGIASSILYSARTLCKAVYEGDKPVAVYGLAPSFQEEDDTYPWMLKSKDFEPSLEFWKRSKREVLPELLRKANGRHMRNWVHEDNRKSIHWLKFMGFTFKNDCGGKMLEFKYTGD